MRPLRHIAGTAIFLAAATCCMPMQLPLALLRQWRFETATGISSNMYIVTDDMGHGLSFGKHPFISLPACDRATAS